MQKKNKILLSFTISFIFLNSLNTNADTKNNLDCNSDLQTKNDIVNELNKNQIKTELGCSLDEIYIPISCNLSLHGVGDLSKENPKKEKPKKENSKKQTKNILSRGYIQSKHKKQTPIKMTEEERHWLLKLIEAESANEPLAGKLAVATTIANRVNSSSFPNTVYGVIKQNNGKFHQYSPWDDGSIHKRTPSKDTIYAVSEVFDKGNRTLPLDTVYFYAPKYATNNWIGATRKYITQIGNHIFCSIKPK